VNYKSHIGWKSGCGIIYKWDWEDIYVYIITYDFRWRYCVHTLVWLPKVQCNDLTTSPYNPTMVSKSSSTDFL